MTKAERRFPWIEASLRFSGCFGAREKKAYRDRFGLTPSMVSRDQDAFCEEFNARCGYHAVAKTAGRLEPGGPLPSRPVFGLPRITHWLEDALGSRFEYVPPIRRAEPNPDILRAVVQAIGRQGCLLLQYRSRLGESDRIVSPHTILEAAGRLHLRAWDHGRSAARDFVMSRMVSASPFTSARYVGSENDLEWSSHVVLEVLPAEGEDADALRLDYGLDETGRAWRRVRKAHAIYLCAGDPQAKNLEREPVVVRVGKPQR